ncbi:polysaccharide biosynthesis tyrosine autokinase [candidate division WOR-3 bacterium]|nr:polysaccharide biosynthesis tyrosine autokinase [candidate division WOR-3 bacterium]
MRSDGGGRNTPASGQNGRVLAVEEQLGARDYFERFWRRKWVALAVFAVVFGLTVLSIARTRPVFEASATVVLANADEGNIFGRTSGYLWPRGPNVAKSVQLLGSRKMAERVAELLPDTLDLSPGMLRGMVSASPVRETDIVRLTAAAGSPDVAVVVVNAYVEAYRDFDLEQSRADVSTVRQFIDDQLAVVGARLDSSERGLAQFKSQNQFTDLDAETRALIQRQSTIAAAYQQAVTDFTAGEAELAHVRSEIEQEGAGMADRLEGISSPMVASLRAALNQLEVERTNLLMRGFDETSERIRGLEQQIDSTRARLKEESRALISQQGFVDPVGRLSGLFEAALTLETRQVAAGARRDALAQVLDRYEVSVSRLPETERALAGLTRDVETDRRVYALLSERWEEARIQEVGKTSAVQVLDLARGAGQTKPDVPSTIGLGLVLALALAVGSAWVVDRLDSSLRTPEEMERRGYPVLAGIPQLPGLGRRGELGSHLITHSDARSSGAEAFRMLRTNLGFTAVDRPLRTIVVTSAVPGEGKSTVAVNLAAVLAQSGARVLLVDADLRQPVLHGLFGREREPGLTDLILAGEPGARPFSPTPVDGLSFLAAGAVPPSPADLLLAPTTRRLLETLAGEFDHVVLDTPPALIAADAPILVSQADAAIVVVRAGRTPARTVEDVRRTLANSGGFLAGFVLNGVRRPGRYGRSYYYYHKYHYQERPGKCRARA